MLTQIKKIKNFGVFDNYAASSGQRAFERYNIIYGENGSGKTTLSRLLGCLQAGEHKEFPSLEFSIETTSGSLTHGQNYLQNVRVFNSDFIEANIGRFDGPLPHILILGEDNRTLFAEIKSDITTRDDRIKRLEEISTAISKLEVDRGKAFSTIAKTIGEATSGSTLRNYRKPDAEAAFSNLSNADSLDDQQLEIHRATLRQEQMAEVGTLNFPSIVDPRTGKTIGPVGAASVLGERCKALTMRSAQSAVIARLASLPEISAWVEKGLALHNQEAGATCEFCAQPLQEARLQALAGHFSREDQQLKAEIDLERVWIAEVLRALGGFTLPDRLALYSELRDDYDAAVSAFENELAAVKGRVAVIDGLLADKLTRRTEAYDGGEASDVGALNVALTSLAAVMQRHDAKTKGFEAEKVAARDAIEAHYLLTIKPQVDVLVEKIGGLKSEKTLLEGGGEDLPDTRSLAAITQSIVEKQARISNKHKGGEELTAYLKQFLGRTDLVLENNEEGYVVLRRGRPARRLSEGEKTAIAFLYFLVQLKDRDFDLAEGVVVIDDPISSLDSGAIYQAFAFLKEKTKEAKQLFILTHNHEFLRLVINWFQNVPRKVKASYSMIVCTEAKEGRSAKIVPLDSLLIEHSTEYQYLFKVLYIFKSDGSILGCYHVPNVARKVLETFLEFQVPSKKSIYQKLEEIDFDPSKKTAIYKFANDHSHFSGKGFDPALVAETQKNTVHLLDMIKHVAPSHFAGLEALAKA